MTSEEKHPSLLPGRWYRVTPHNTSGGLRLYSGFGKPPYLGFQGKSVWGTGLIGTDVIGIISWDDNRKSWLCISLSFGGVFVLVSGNAVEWCHFKNVTRWVEKSTKNIPDF